MKRLDLFAAIILLCSGFGISIARAADPPAAVPYLDQGWSPEQRQRYYRLYEGSQLVPYEWFRALERAGSEELLGSDASMARFGYLPNRGDPRYNPDDLPVGFVKERDPRTGNWLGLNCAACHTGQVEYRGHAVRIDGAPALADFMAFRDALIATLQETQADPAKFERFANRLSGRPAAGEPAAALHVDIRRYTEDFLAYAARNTPPHSYGPGRLDALGISLNEVCGASLRVPENVQPPAAPVSYPALWLTPRMEWVQWNGAVANPLTRNIGQALSVFGRATLTGPITEHFASTVLVRNLYELEQHIVELRPPAWPDNLLGPIDREAAKRGATIYQREDCARCHFDRPPYPVTPANIFGKSFIQVKKTPLKDLQTDPIAAEAFANRNSKTGRLGVYFNDPKGAGSVQEVSTAVMFGFVATMVAERQLDELRLTDEEKLAYRGYRERTPPGDLLVYRAGTLAGTWANAPYLHNGSVPSLEQLLLPPDRRARKFHVGNREFDPKAVGFSNDAGPFEFDTALPGNSNAGHDYGTRLTEEERRDLIEYLKTL